MQPIAVCFGKRGTSSRCIDNPPSPSKATMTGSLEFFCARLVSIACSSGVPSANNSPPILCFLNRSRTCFFFCLSALAGKVATSNCPTFSGRFMPASTESVHCLQRASASQERERVSVCAQSNALLPHKRAINNMRRVFFIYVVTWMRIEKFYLGSTSVSAYRHKYRFSRNAARVHFHRLCSDR